MPELPEIETIRTALEPQIINRIMKKVTLRRPDLRFAIPKKLPKKVQGSPITAVHRRSKYLLIDFKNGQTLIVHLGMSGRLFFTDKNREYDKHDHVLFDFNEGKHLRFRDPRRFGLLDICKTKHLANHKLFKNLGVEPLSDDFTAECLLNFCKKSSAPIKSLIMNANNVVGVGNIYANEALFLSGILPTRLGKKITLSEASVLCANIKKILLASIKLGGTSFRDYVGISEDPGLHQLSLKVYGREGEKCKVCGQKILRVVQSNRSSFYCAKCQK